MDAGGRFIAAGTGFCLQITTPYGTGGHQQNLYLYLLTRRGSFREIGQRYLSVVAVCFPSSGNRTPSSGWEPIHVAHDINPFNKPLLGYAHYPGLPVRALLSP